LIRPACAATARSAIVPHPGFSGDRYRSERLAKRSDLVWLDQHRIRDTFLDAPAHERRAGSEHIVADRLDPLAEAPVQQLPPLAIALRKRILECHDWVTPGQLHRSIRQLLAGEPVPYRSRA